MSREQWIKARRQALTLIPGTLEVARKLSQVAGIAMLTNNGSLLKESLPELMPELCGLFSKALHASCEFNARKPDKLEGDSLGTDVEAVGRFSARP